MKGPPFICFLVLIILTMGCGDVGKDSDQGQEKETVVSPMQIGISYYPERRPRELWNVDFEKLVDAGIKRIRIGEFAWSTLEPDEGEFDFHCFDDCIDLAQRYGIEVMMCTPTAAPPIWLIEKYPEILPLNADRQRNTFGARQHRCYNTPAYVQHTDIIVDKLAARYANHPNVVAWQIDNEMGGEQKRCFCQHCRDQFHNFLEQEYTDIETLNKRWGNSFWSLEYKRFNQVVLPYRYNATLMLKHHPSLELEFSRFSSRSIVLYSNMQATIIRKHNPGTIITTNRFAYAWGDNVNAFELDMELDAAGFDLYSTRKHQVAFYADLNRGLSEERNWVLEYGTDSPDLYGEMKILEARGVQWLYLFKLNPFPAGMEQSNRSLLSITGKPTENYHVVKQWNEEKHVRDNRKVQQPETVIYYDFDCSWVLAQDGWGSYRDKLVYQAYVIDTVYQALFNEEIAVNILHTLENLEDIKVMILPQQLVHTPSLESSVMGFIESGGTVITTHNLFWKNADNVYLTETPEIYNKVISRPGEFFLDPPGQALEYSYGSGKIIIVPGDAGIKEWTQIINTCYSPA